ncbi:MAG TPA: acyclic terpene utilization AtuA family protein [Terriglobia bacterium]|nr:acyclic terpene utilization AtuA family protein [Terriglobia bacterium]
MQLSDISENTVEVKGVKDKPATGFYKASMAYFDGYTATGTLTYAWPMALEKARKADEILRERLADWKLQFDEIPTEFLGYDSCFGPRAQETCELNEVVLRVGVRSHDKAAIERFSRELAPLILTGPPSCLGENLEQRDAEDGITD